MIFSEILLAKQAVAARMQAISKAAGDRYNVTYRPAVSADFKGQADVEIGFSVPGYTLREQQTSAATDIDLHVSAWVLCARRLANDANSIEDISILVVDDITTALMSDVTQGGTCIFTTMGDGESNDSTDQGYYGWQIEFYLFVRCRSKDSY